MVCRGGTHSMGKGPMLGKIGKELCTSVCHGIVDMHGRYPHDRLTDLVGKVCNLCSV
jgi:hypothetical protein